LFLPRGGIWKVVPGGDSWSTPKVGPRSGCHSFQEGNSAVTHLPGSGVLTRSSLLLSPTGVNLYQWRCTLWLPIASSQRLADLQPKHLRVKSNSLLVLPWILLKSRCEKVKLHLQRSIISLSWLRLVNNSRNARSWVRLVSSMLSIMLSKRVVT